MSEIHAATGRFSDIADAADSQKFRKSLALIRRIAAAAKERFEGWQEQHQNGLSSVVRFADDADDLVSSIRRRVDDEIRNSSGYGRMPDLEPLKTRLRIEGMLSIALYRLQYDLACMVLPCGWERPANGAVYRISEMFLASNETSQELGGFLDAISVGRGEYSESVETLRGFFLSKSDRNCLIREDKERVSAVFVKFAEAYLEFRINGPPGEYEK
jgi:hypothetical protein